MIGTVRDAVTQARVSRLWIADDGGLTAARMQRTRRLRQRIRRACGSSLAGPLVFLSRGTDGVGRRLVNEDAVAEALRREGFTILNPQREAPGVVAETLHSARIVVTVEGSAAVHALMACPDDAGLIVIQPASRFTLNHHRRCSVYGQRFGYTVADDVGDGDVFQPIDRLRRTIDLMDAAIH